MILGRCTLSSIPDPKIGWILFSIFKAIYIIKKEKISLIYSTSPPYTTSLIALLTKFFTKTIWICDFRDIWTNNSLQPQRRLVAKWIDKFFERKVFEYCDYFTVAWSGIINFFHTNNPHVNINKAYYIPNG